MRRLRHKAGKVLSKEQRFWGKVQKTSGCWLWIARSRSHDGYGIFFNGGYDRQIYAHRFAYTILKGPIPEGLQLDHLCRNRLCVNPDHLEPVTARTNILRGIGPFALKARQTHCKYGHPFDLPNTYLTPRGTRDCRKCHALAEKRRRAKR